MSNIISKDDLKTIITQAIMKVLSEPFVTVGVSNRHIHLTQADLDTLFGRPLSPMRDLMPGHYAANECVTIHGPKGEIKRVRILGPVRSATQAEISITDAYALGVKPKIAESGNLQHAQELTITNSETGVSVVRKCGIVALRHIHMGVEFARKHGLADKQMVSVEFTGVRSQVFNNTLVRVSPDFVEEMHVDMDEANSAGIATGDLGRIILAGSPAQRLSVDTAKEENTGGSRVYEGNVLSRAEVLSFSENGILRIGSKVLVTMLAREEAAKRGITIRRE